jgi:hypothetical protein
VRVVVIIDIFGLLDILRFGEVFYKVFGKFLEFSECWLPFCKVCPSLDIFLKPVKMSKPIYRTWPPRHLHDFIQNSSYQRVAYESLGIGVVRFVCVPSPIQKSLVPGERAGIQN